MNQSIETIFHHNVNNGQKPRPSHDLHKYKTAIMNPVIMMSSEKLKQRRKKNKLQEHTHTHTLSPSLIIQARDWGLVCRTIVVD
ncbi:hypothetical protein QYF36_008186 [Acer negundo]|nr:hypothetical protein QYF36_008186 [Acer negundo]